MPKPKGNLQKLVERWINQQDRSEEAREEIQQIEEAEQKAWENMMKGMFR